MYTLYHRKLAEKAEYGRIIRYHDN